MGDAATIGLLAVGDLGNHVLFLRYSAMLCCYAGEISRGTTYEQQAFRLAQERDDAPSACEAMTALGLLAYSQDDFERALVLLEESLDKAAQLPNGKQLAWHHYHMG